MKSLLTILVVFNLFLIQLYSEDKIINLGENEEIGEILLLSQTKVIKLKPNQKSIQGLHKLCKEKSSSIIWYDEAEGHSAIGFVGLNKVSFISNKNFKDLQALSHAELDAIFKKNKPVSYADYQKKYYKNAENAQSSVPIQISPTMFSLILKNRPSDFIVCKTHQGIFYIQILKIIDKENSIKLKIRNKNIQKAQQD